MEVDGEPMIEIFLEECTIILSELSEQIEKGRERQSFDRELLNEIFRSIHTIKADAAIMMFENIAAVARTLEKVLYFYRDEKGKVTDTAGFLALMDDCFAFFCGEFQQLLAGGSCNISSRELTERVIRYYVTISGRTEELGKLKAGSNFPDENVQESIENSFDITDDEDEFFYISADESQETISIPPKEQQAESKSVLHPKHILLPVEEIKLLESINTRLLKHAHDTDAEVQSILRELDNWLWRVHSTDFSLMAAKLDRTVKDMLKHMDKQVIFTFNGKDLTFDKSKMEKMSSAMIHLVRNAVDHGIESKQERRLAGKSPCGYVNVEVKEQDDHSGICVRVSDDGRGMDMFEILDKANERGLLEKPYEQYTESEALNLIFHPGFTTKNEVGEYSGRGVGMDAVRHNIKEIGGTIQIESVFGIGTTIIINISYENSHIDDAEKRRAVIDESLNSRR